MRVTNWRMRSFEPLLRTHPEVPRENAITVGAFVAIRQIGPNPVVALGKLGSKSSGWRRRPDQRLGLPQESRRRIGLGMSSPLDWVLTIANFELHSIIPRYSPIPHRHNFACG